MEQAIKAELSPEQVPASVLKPDEILVGERLYAEAIDIVLSHAQQELLIFDQDFSHGDFTSLAKYSLLERFLSHSQTSRLTIILQDVRYFQEKCPRLLTLLKVYGHKMTVYETDNTAKHAKDCFILADGAHYIKRIHIDQARFKYNLNDATAVDTLKSRFDDLLEATQYAISPTTLGL